MEIGHFSKDSSGNSKNLKQLLENYLSYKKWFIISVLVCFVGSFLLVRTMTPRYAITSSILIKENEEGKSISDLSSFEDLGLFGGDDRTLENEVQILKSRRLMTKVVEELKLNVQYYLEDSPYDKEFYPNYPILFEVHSSELKFEDISSEFFVHVKSSNTFDFFDFDDKKIEGVQFGDRFQANLGNEDIDNPSRISIETFDEFDENLIGEVLRVRIFPVDAATDYYMNNIEIKPINEKLSRVLTISYKETVKAKGIAIINNLVQQYNADGINDKNMISQATTDFLDMRLDLISNELMAIEGTAEQFKSKNRIVDSEKGASYFLESSTLNERELVEANTQLQLINYMLDEINKKGSNELLPANIGLSDMGIITLISEYNELVLQRNRVMKSSSEMNPIIVGIDSQLNVLKENLRGTLSTQKSSSEIRISALNREGGKISSKIASVPKNEREYKDIVREQETKNALYLFLLQKREESILSNAVSIDKAKIIDEAFSSRIPVSPKKTLIYLASMLFGFMVPIGFIYVKDLLDTKVHTEGDLKFLGVPYLGDVPYSRSKKEAFIKADDSSNVAEAFRYIRTNINFMLDSKDKCKTILVTSTEGGEGKTFTAINLAYSLAASGNRTLLLGMDLRAPKIDKYLKLVTEDGVTNYIKNENLGLSDVIRKIGKIDNLEFISSGDIPPNPVELLMHKRVDELFMSLEDYYDFIIVDSAPVGLVTDTLQISRYSDLTIYVVKADSLDKRMLHIPEKMFYENKLPNMAFLINGTNQTAGNYGYGYGYGKNRKKKWHERLTSSFTEVFTS